jgi:hypothetical protein
MLMSKRFQFTRLCSRCYSGCQKNVPVFKRFFLQPLIPQFRNSEHYYESGIKIFKETICRLLFTIQALTLIHNSIKRGKNLLWLRFTFRARLRPWVRSSQGVPREGCWRCQGLAFVPQPVVPSADGRFRYRKGWCTYH